MPAAVGTEWRRLHPATPLVKGWQPVVAALAIGLQDGLGPVRLAITSGLTFAVVIISGIGFYLNWRVSRYRLDGPDLVVETGVVMKRSRRVPLARLQAVDVVRPLLARALGLAELRLEVAGGSGSNASLAYLDEATAHAVRNDLLALAAGLRDDVTAVPAPPEAHETVVAVTSTTRLVAASLLSGPVLLLALTLASFAIGAALLSEDPVVAVVGVGVPMLLSVGGQVWNSFAKSYGSVLAESPDGLRIRRGLLETRSQTVPPGRVQGVLLREPMSWRPFGWVRVAATVAGYESGSTSGGALLLPVADKSEARDVAARVLPGVGWDTVSLRGVPARARWRAPIEVTQLAAGIGDEGAERVLVTRRGRVGRRTDIVPLARVQSVRLRQGPVQRALRLASVHADLSPGPVRASALHRDLQEGRVLLDQLVRESRTARAATRPDRWLRSAE